MTFHVTRDRRHPGAIRLTENDCQLCYGSGWIPGVAGDGPLDEEPCPECSTGTPLLSGLRRNDDPDELE